MVESYIKIKRKDYLKVCELLEQMSLDTNISESEKDKAAMKAIINQCKNKVSVIQNILMEDC